MFIAALRARWLWTAFIAEIPFHADFTKCGDGVAMGPGPEGKTKPAYDLQTK